MLCYVARCFPKLCLAELIKATLGLINLFVFTKLLSARHVQLMSCCVFTAPCLPLITMEMKERECAQWGPMDGHFSDRQWVGHPATGLFTGSVRCEFMGSEFRGSLWRCETVGDQRDRDRGHGVLMRGDTGTVDGGGSFAVHTSGLEGEFIGGPIFTIYRKRWGVSAYEMGNVLVKLYSSYINILVMLYSCYSRVKATLDVRFFWGWEEIGPTSTPLMVRYDNNSLNIVTTMLEQTQKSLWYHGYDDFSKSAKNKFLFTITAYREQWVNCLVQVQNNRISPWGFDLATDRLLAQRSNH